MLGQGFNLIAGVDEAGRGALAGPVVAAAVILSADAELDGLDDSKKLTPAKRAELYRAITNGSAHYGIGVMSAQTVDRLNVRVAALAAMAKAVKRLPDTPDYLFVDGRDTIPYDVAQRAVIGGDGKVKSVAAASVVAKYYRDSLMVSAGERYPDYGFAEHKGYGTAYHRAILKKIGHCPLHRKTFKPCRVEKKR
ncbi:MAG: ribonuclease HII [bacterium]|nr:ribonuclease HII [bacterium]